MELVRAELHRGTMEATRRGILASLDRAGVVLHPVFATDARAAVELSIGRVYWPCVTFEDGTISVLDQQPVSLNNEGELQQIVLDL